MVDFKEKLAQQLRFLQRSCEVYDSGEVEEALRIATALRVIFHNAGRSKSLLNHLNGTDILLSSTIPIDDGEWLFHGSRLSSFFLHINNQIGNPQVEGVSRPKGRAAILPQNSVPFQTWWKQAIYLIFGGKTYTREEIVLVAANNDGGAHVDDKLPPIYLILSNELAITNAKQDPETGMGEFEISFSFEPKEGNGQKIKGGPYADLRQMAEEVLCSEAITALTR